MRAGIAMAVGLLASCGTVAAQSQIVLNEDFEDGLQGWTVGNPVGPPPSPLWRLAEDGECGVTVSRMAAYALPAPDCSYALGAVAGSQLLSDAFVLAGHGPWTLRLDVIWGLDSGASTVTPFVRNESTGEQLVLPLAALDAVYETSHAVTAALELPGWEGAAVRLGFSVLTQAGAAAGSGLRLDNVVLRSSAYDSVGAGLPGLAGHTPRLDGDGPLTVGSEGALHISDAAPRANAWLIAGRTTLMLPYLGGVIVPLPAAIMTGRTDAAGRIDLPFVLPQAAPGSELWFQCWIEDPSAPEGLSCTNGLKATTS